MRRNLTAKLIENLQPRIDRRYEVRDQLLPGFGVRVSTSGKKSWFAVGRVGGRQVRHTIGNYPTVTLREAREAARLILKDIQLGLYAPAKADLEVKLPTLSQMITLFIEIYAKPKNRGWKAVQATLRKFSTLNDRPIAEITRADVVKVLDSIAAGGAPIAANRAMSAVKKLFAWSLDRGAISVHPLVGLRKPGTERSRDRVLTDEELTSLWHATEQLGFPFGPAFQLLALTGQRRGEVVGMRWSQIDMDRGTWTIPAEVAKNERDMHRQNEVGEFLAQLTEMSEAIGCAVLGIAHLNKQSVEHPLYRIVGSIGFAASIRSALFLGSDPDDPDNLEKVALAHGKHNASEGGKTMLFRKIGGGREEVPTLEALELSDATATDVS
jgi:Arm domain-containing DNA-binding protein/integrase-like protein